MKKSGLIYFFLIIAVSNLNLIGCRSDKQTVQAKLNNKTYTFELALTHKQKMTGLMHRRQLAKNGGMLFVYSYPRMLDFYMKNTLIPLDLAYIDGERKIISIEAMEPLDETSVSSPQKAMYVLEVNRGFFEKNNIKIGDAIEFLSPIPYIEE